MLRFGNAATPATAAAVVVPESVPPPALEPIVTLMLPAKPVATLPSASCAVTCTAGVIAAPAVAVVGCTLKTSTLGAPAVTLNAALVPPLTPEAPAVSVPPLSPENVATPAPAATLVVPVSAPAPGLFPSATVTDAVKLVTVLPNPSCAVTCTAGVIGAPAVTLVGCTVNTSLFAAAALMIKEALGCPVSPVADVVSV